MLDTIRAMAAESDDVFHRHRGAVLDVLLSETTLGEPDEPCTSPDDPTTVPRSTDPDAGIEHGFDEVPPAPPGRTPGAAGARINALLSGQPDQVPPMAELMGATAVRSPAPPNPPDTEPPDPPTPAGRTPLNHLLADARRIMTGRLRWVVLITAVVLVGVLVALVASPGPDLRSDPLVTRTLPASPAIQPSTTSLAPAIGSPIQVRTAESKCPAGSTPGMDAFAGVPGKAWSCVRAYQVDGQVLRIDLGSTYQIDSIAIVPGWDYVANDGTDQWNKYRTASRVSYRFNDTDVTTYTQETLDQRGVVVTRFEPAVKASRIILTVLRSAGDSSVNTTAISSIVITGR